MKKVYVVLDKGCEEAHVCTTRELAEKWMADNERKLYMPSIATDEIDDDGFDILLECEAEQDEIDGDFWS